MNNVTEVMPIHLFIRFSRPDSTYPAAGMRLLESIVRPGEGAACLEESFVPVATQSTDLRPTPQRNKIVTKICLLCSFQKTVHGYHDIREEQSVLSLSAFPEGTHDGNAPDTGIAR